MTRTTSSTFHEDLLGHPAISLVYLFFVFVPLLFWEDWPLSVLLLSVLATAVFVPVYLSFSRRGLPWRRQRQYLLVVSALGLLLIPVNPGGHTFLIYAMAMGARVLAPRQTLLLYALLVLLAAVLFWLFLPVTQLAVSYTMMLSVIGAIVTGATLYARLREQRNAELRLSQEEVRRLARVAERERISRDLHDLLGHTLSLVVLKAELAGKLISRDSSAAAREIGDVEQIARKALSEVRDAVTGMRVGGLEAELAAARLALLSVDASMDQNLQPLKLSNEAESALALSLREAITNTIRHADASRVEIELRAQHGQAELQISDDGQGGIVAPGNGLAGMRQRLEALGGSMLVDSPAGAGTRLRLRVPLLTSPTAEST